MTALARTVFENHQIRKGRRRKRAFVQCLAGGFAREGLALREEKAGLGGRNLILGEPETAKLLFTAHYDTCAMMPLPNFITPKNVPLFLLYQLAITAVIIVLALGVALLGALLGIGEGAVPPLFSLAMLAFVALMLFGPANRHTANDNTSGVVCLIDTALALPEELRAKIAFVFFDQEELGLFGSLGFAAKHPRAAREAYVLNLDCIGDGDDILLVLPRKCPADLERLLRESFLPREEKRVIFGDARTTLYPSDQASFRRGVGVAALRRTRRGMLYLDRIHTARDTVCDAKNIAFVKEALLRAAAGAVGTQNG